MYQYSNGQISLAELKQPVGMNLLAVRILSVAKISKMDL